MTRYMTSAATALVLTWALVPGVGGAGTAEAQQRDTIRSGVPSDSAEVRRLMQQQLGTGASQAEVLERIRQSGLSRSELRSRLEQMGYDPALVDRYFDVIEQGGEPPRGQVSGEFLDALQRTGVETRDIRRGPGADSIGALGFVADSMRLDSLARFMAAEGQDTIFGQSLFVYPTTQFEPVLMGPVPPDYRLGPGDELQLILTGDVELVYMLDVMREGTLVIPDVGQIYVNGLTLAELEDQLYDRLGRVYSGVRRGPEATTHFQVSLGRLRTNEVYVIGEVRRPGAYEVSAGATVFNALYRALGPNEIGSFRQVQVRRGAEVVARVDVYDYLIGGDGRSDIRLEHGDVVFVPVTGARVRVRGAVRRPMIYELKPDDGLRDLVAYAGDFRANALIRRVQIDRILAPSERRAGVDRVLVDVDLTALEEPSGDPIGLRDGDHVEVFAVNEERRNRVTIEGKVERPGVYEWTAGTTLGDVVASAGGLAEEAYRARAHVFRLNAADSTRQLLRVPLPSEAGAGDIALADRDSVVIYSRAELRTANRVEIDGFVKNPGTFSLADGMSPKDLILAAGGFLDGAYVLEAEVARRPDPLTRTDTTAQVVRVPLMETAPLEIGADDADGVRYTSRAEVPGAGRGLTAEQLAGIPNWLPDAEEFELRHGDRVVIRKAPGYEAPRIVTVTGEVALPGTYVLRTRRERMTDVLQRAGGFTPEAYTDGLRLVRDSSLVATDAQQALGEPDGRHNVVLEAGDSIHVPEYDPTVLVEGAVPFESRVLYRPGAGLGYYIEQAGGYTDASDKDRVTVTFQNGAREAVNKFLFFRMTPDPRPGSTIVVPEKPASERAGFDWDRFLGRTASALTALASIIIATDRIRD